MISASSLATLGIGGGVQRIAAASVLSADVSLIVFQSGPTSPYDPPFQRLQRVGDPVSIPRRSLRQPIDDAKKEVVDSLLPAEVRLQKFRRDTPPPRLVSCLQTTGQNQTRDDET